LQEDAPHAVNLINCTRHLATSIEMELAGSQPASARGLA
jgi:hypothetical protein